MQSIPKTSPFNTQPIQANSSPNTLLQSNSVPNENINEGNAANGVTYMQIRRSREA